MTHPADTPSDIPAGIPADIPAAHGAEYDALCRLLLESAAPGDPNAASCATAIARAALEPGHLWRSMSLASREDLRSIFREHFPALHEANDKDMRWKKFLYKRLCGWEGFHA